MFSGAENLVRHRQPEEAHSPLPYVVEVEGLPNLLHEMVHVLLVGELRKDHGTDLSQLPFALDSSGGRLLLWQEFACCSVSAGWHPGSTAEAHDWFREQIEIQPWFFGHEEQPARFFRRVDELLKADLSWMETERSAHDLLAQALEDQGACCRPPRTEGLAEFWRSYRALDSQS